MTINEESAEMPVNEEPLESGEDLLARRRELRERAQARYGSNDKESKSRIREMENAIADHVSLRMQVEKAWRAECSDDELAYEDFPKQWEKLKLEFPACSPLKPNTMDRDVRHAVDYLAASSTEGNVKVSGRRLHERGQDSDSKHQHVARNFGARYRAVKSAIDFSHLRKELIQHVCVTGVGYFHHGVKHNSRTDHLEFFGEVPGWRNVYTDGLSKGMEKASFFFIVNPTSLQTLLASFPGKADEIRRFAQDFSGSAENGPSTLDIQIFHGRGYIYDFFNWEGKYYEICMSVNFVAYEDFSQVRLLENPTHEFGHNDIPVCQVKFDEDPCTGYPFSPLVRQRRGLERAMIDTLRQTMLEQETGDAGITSDRRPKGITRMEIDAIMHDKCNQNLGLSPKLKGRGNVRFVNYEEEMKQRWDNFNQLNELAQPTAGMHSNMPQLARRQDMWQFSGPRMSLDSDLVKRAAEQILSNIEQFDDAIDYRFMMDQEDLTAYGFDADQSLSGYQAWVQLAGTQGART